MITEEGKKYVREQLSMGVSESTIRDNLRNNGWQEQDINEIISAAPTANKLSYPIGRVFRIYKEKTEQVLKILLPGLIVAAIGMVVLPSGEEGLRSTILPYPNEGIENIAVLCWSLIQSLVTFLMSIALLAFAASGYSLSANDSWSKVKTLALPYLWVTVLQTLAIAGGFILLIIPGIIFAIWFIFSNMVVVSEGLRGTAALKESKKYVTGNWWAIFIRMLLLGFSIYAIIFFPMLLLSALNLLRPMPHLTNFLSMILTVLVSPISVFYLFELYRDAKAVYQTKASTVI